MDKDKEFQKLKGMLPPDKAQQLEEEMKAQGLNFGSLLNLLPLFVKYLPMLKEFFKELAETGVVTK